MHANINTYLNILTCTTIIVILLYSFLGILHITLPQVIKLERRFKMIMFSIIIQFGTNICLYLLILVPLYKSQFNIVYKTLIIQISINYVTLKQLSALISNMSPPINLTFGAIFTVHEHGSKTQIWSQRVRVLPIPPNPNYLCYLCRSSTSRALQLSSIPPSEQY